MITSVSILLNGFNIAVTPEHGHYKLSHGQKEQRCDVGELNEAIPDFAEMLAEEQRKICGNKTAVI